MEKSNVIVTHELNQAVCEIAESLNPDRIFLLMDNTTARLCRPLAETKCPLIGKAIPIIIDSGDTSKNLSSLSSVWTALQGGMATRHSLLINLGGGMVTDLGGFAASTFKRGIAFINVPTTVLAMVDASAGGKTGINFGGLKNEIGVFSDAARVVIDTDFLKTLDEENIRSGYAEMIKHGLISDDRTWAELLKFNLENPDIHSLARLIEQSVKIKERVVAADPHEKGLRKALNLGHTVGHAFESFSLKSPHPILHGYAVAYGLIAELYLSCIKAGFPTSKMRATVNFIRQHYGQLQFSCNDYDELYKLMLHDKKNVAGIINFTLLHDIGQLRIDSHATREEIFDMLDFYREG